MRSSSDMRQPYLFNNIDPIESKKQWYDQPELGEAKKNWYSSALTIKNGYNKTQLKL